MLDLQELFRCTTTYRDEKNRIEGTNTGRYRVAKEFCGTNIRDALCVAECGNTTPANIMLPRSAATEYPAAASLFIPLCSTTGIADKTKI